MAARAGSQPAEKWSVATLPAAEGKPDQRIRVKKVKPASFEAEAIS